MARDAKTSNVVVWTSTPFMGRRPSISNYDGVHVCCLLGELSLHVCYDFCLLKSLGWTWNQDGCAPFISCMISLSMLNSVCHGHKLSQPWFFLSQGLVSSFASRTPWTSTPGLMITQAITDECTCVLILVCLAS